MANNPRGKCEEILQRVTIDLPDAYRLIGNYAVWIVKGRKAG